MKNPRVLWVLAVGAALAAVAGCAPSAAPATPTPYSSASSTPTPSPTPTPTLTAITVTSQSLVATDQNGTVLADLPYKVADPATIEILTALFGFAPTVTETPRETHTDAFGGTIYDWEGFSVRWPGRWADEPGSGYPDISVRASTASVRGVPVATAGGLAVGDPGDLTVQFPDSSDTFAMSDGGVLTSAWIDCIAVEVPEVPNAADCVGLFATPSDVSITTLSAPYQFAYGL
jgi:hypothetical protein